MEKFDGLKQYLVELSDNNKEEFLTCEQERELVNKAQNGDENARNDLLIKNGLLVVSVAKEYIGQGIPLEDLISVGNLGLLHAIEVMDPQKARLTTYGTIWIRQAVRRYIADQKSAIRLPAHMSEALSSLIKKRAGLEDVLGREATVDELVDVTGLSKAKIEKTLAASRISISSLDVPVGDGECALGSFVADESQNTEQAFLQTELHEQLMELMDRTLKEREKEVVLYAFGFVDGSPKTLRELAEHFQLSRERCRQIKQAALLKLHKKGRHLADYLQ